MVEVERVLTVVRVVLSLHLGVPSAHGVIIVGRVVDLAILGQPLHHVAPSWHARKQE